MLRSRLWTTKYGRTLEIKDMKDTHLQNAINMIRRGTDWEGDTVSQTTASKLPLLIEELHRRQYNIPLEVTTVTKVNMEKDKYTYIEVRFANNPSKMYCYKVKKSAKTHLGQKLIVENEQGNSVVFVVGLNSNMGHDGTVEITEKVVSI